MSTRLLVGRPSQRLFPLHCDHLHVRRALRACQPTSEMAPPLSTVPHIGHGRVLSIQSHTVQGYVGNKAAVFPLQLLGFDVDPINSVQFSNHTGYPVWRGQVLNGEELWSLIEGLEANDLLYYTHLLTGYIGSLSFLECVLRVVEKLRSVNPDLIYDKVLAFIQQFDAAFGDEGFTESSKLRHVAMHFQKSARQWWASLRANGEVPLTWKNLRASIMKQFLSSDAKVKVLTEWQSLKLTPFESIHKYVDKFWDLHLKATVYKDIDFEEQNQQFCAGLPEDMNEYVNLQRPKSISAVIHHTMVAARINFQQGAKKNLKPMETKEKHDLKGKNHPQNSSKGNSSNNNAKEKGVYKGKNRLTREELER
ncbi:hypothetical protein L7F22_048514 [Adiantum nelumboides]|nr:hypothetical protein [Adiantum nelumboides]